MNLIKMKQLRFLFMMLELLDFHSENSNPFLVFQQEYILLFHQNMMVMENIQFFLCQLKILIHKLYIH